MNNLKIVAMCEKTILTYADKYQEERNQGGGDEFVLSSYKIKIEYNMYLFENCCTLTDRRKNIVQKVYERTGIIYTFKDEAGNKVDVSEPVKTAPQAKKKASLKEIIKDKIASIKRFFSKLFRKESAAPAADNVPKSPQPL
jgi:hypothetical protein